MLLVTRPHHRFESCSDYKPSEAHHGPSEMETRISDLYSQVAELVDATQIVNYNNNKDGLLHVIRIALSQRLIYRFESCPGYKCVVPLRKE